MRLSIVVPATDAPETLGRCLAAIQPGLEDTDQLIVISEPRGLGPAAARNLGAAEATGDVLVFVDADVLIHADGLAIIRDAFVDREAAAVFGSYDSEPDAPGLVSSFRNLLHHTVHQRAAGDVSTFWSGLGAVRRTSFEAVGGFDAERYRRPSIEDVELGTRLVQRGRITLLPELQGTHLKRWTLRSMVVTDFRDRALPWLDLLRERRPGADTLNADGRGRASVVLAVVALIAALRRRPLSFTLAVGAHAQLNRSVLGHMRRRHGIAGIGGGAALHILHHLVSAAAVPTWLVTRAGCCCREGGSELRVDDTVTVDGDDGAARPARSRSRPARRDDVHSPT